ncbi:MAG: hypothetical protein KDD55_11115, partial [Bdellovibrionales bacterium]|nr:hypothetical protein [Bdellovibrionales bacterium]
GGSIADSYASGLIAGHEYVGGLVGYSTRAIDRSAARVSITVIRSEESNAQEFGGLVGRNAGRITSSFAESSFQFFGTGLPVTNLGGLVGYHSSKRIETSYAIADMSQITSDTIEAEKVGCFIGQSTIPNRGYNDVVGSYCVGDVPSGAYAFAGTNRLGGHELYGQSNLYDSDVEWNNSDPIALGVPTGVFSSEDLLSSLDPIWYFLTHLTYEVSSTGYPTLRDNQFD